MSSKANPSSGQQSATASTPAAAVEPSSDVPPVVISSAAPNGILGTTAPAVASSANTAAPAGATTTPVPAFASGIQSNPDIDSRPPTTLQSIDRPTSVANPVQPEPSTGQSSQAVPQVSDTPSPGLSAGISMSAGVGIRPAASSSSIFQPVPAVPSTTPPVGASSQPVSTPNAPVDESTSVSVLAASSSTTSTGFNPGPSSDPISMPPAQNQPSTTSAGPASPSIAGPESFTTSISTGGFSNPVATPSSSQPNAPIQSVSESSSSTTREPFGLTSSAPTGSTSSAVESPLRPSEPVSVSDGTTPPASPSRSATPSQSSQTPTEGSVSGTDSQRSTSGTTRVPGSSSVNQLPTSSFEPSQPPSTLSTTYSSTYSPPPSSSSTPNDAYTPTQTWLIMASSSTSTSLSASSAVPTSQTSSTGSSGTPTVSQLPSTAVIPSSIPTLIVPANSAANKEKAGTGAADDPLKDTTLIALLLNAEQYPWTFVVKSPDATSQLFNTFPSLISSALEIPSDDVQTYGLQVYQPATWNGNNAALLTQWLAYIPSKDFDTLNAYLKASNSPLFNQTGIQGDLANQINTAYPLAASPGIGPATTTTRDETDDSTRNRDIIIGVCVGVGGLLWIGLVYWIYKRVKRHNDRDVHKRLSEHMSMFDDRERDMRRVSVAPSIAPSEIDDRPSSFYATPIENDPVFRRQQRRSLGAADAEYPNSLHGSGGSGDLASSNYHPSVFGQSWFANPNPNGHANPFSNAHQPQPYSAASASGREMRQAQSQNPFQDIVTRSYLHASGSTGGLSAMAQRRSGPMRPVQKAMIGQPTLHASSLEFRET